MSESAPETLVVSTIGVHWRLILDVPSADRARIARNWSRAVVAPERAIAAPGGLEDFVVSPAFTGGLGGMTVDTLGEGLDYAFSRSLTMASIKRRAGGALMFHAAGLTAPDGQAIVLVAGSGTGKSTASRILGRSLGYLSDETVAVEDDGRIAAYAKPLSLIPPDADPLAKLETGPDDLGLLPAHPDPRLGAVVMLERDAACPEPVLEPVALIDALAGITPQTSSLLLLDRPLQRLAEAVCRGGGPWRLRYPEISQCVALITGLVDDLTHGRGPEPIQWRAAGGGPEVRERHPNQVDARYQRRPCLDAVESEGSVLIASSAAIMRLDGLGAALWLACAAPRTQADLVAVAERELGAHPEAPALVRGAVSALLEAEVLQISTT